LAGYFTVLAASGGIQIAVAVCARALQTTAWHAANATRREASIREHAEIASRVHEDRHARWRGLQETTIPLLRELAAGSVDPGDECVRQRCAVEAARLRRLMAGSDDVPSVLLHELHATADVAERRGVAIDIESAGSVPEVPADVRGVITDV